MALFALLSAIGGLLPSFSPQAGLFVAASGGILFWLGLSSRVRRAAAAPGPADRARWWLVPVFVLAATELFTFAGGSTPDRPTLSVLADPLLESYPGRSLAYLAWLLGFWALVRR